MKRLQNFSLAKQVVAGVVCLLLIACGGGSGTKNNSGGQKPDPVAVDLAIAYIKRPIPLKRDEMGELITDDAGASIPVYPDLLDPLAFNPGSAVYLQDRANTSAIAVNVTKNFLSVFLSFSPDVAYDTEQDPNLPNLYDVKDLSASLDGKKLLFAMHAPLRKNVKKEDQPKWRIWEYNTVTKVLRPIIANEKVPYPADDVSPHYLRDGRILFSSTRQSRSKAILLDDGKPQFSALEEGGDAPALVLHTMNDDGTDIQQITFNQSHDLQASIMQDGRILYTHWDQSGTDKLSFYTVNPDGTHVERHYGYFSLNVPPATETEPKNRLFRPQEMLDGRIAAILKPDAALLGGEMVVIDTPHFFEDNLQIPAGGATTATAQSPISILPVNIKPGETEFSKHGRYASLAPLYDGTKRLLVSWGECRLQTPIDKKVVPCTDSWLATTGVKEADPLYGIWIYNIEQQTQQPVVLAQEGVMFTEPVSLEVRNNLSFPVPHPDINLQKEGVGALFIRSVYDMDGQFNSLNGKPKTLVEMAQASPENRPARYLRLVKAVSILDKETRDTLGNTTYGDIFKNFGGLHEILGYAPIEADGSVYVKVPADMAFSIEVLDKDGKRIGAKHNNWLQVRAGEVRECNGCHVRTNLTSGHGRDSAQLPAINPIATNIELMRIPNVDIAQESGYKNLTTLALGESFIDLHAPTTEACAEQSGWNSLCRIIINYEQHIQPLWDRPRVALGGKSCNSACHTPIAKDEVDNVIPHVPDGQLDLTSDKDQTTKHMIAYDQLFRAHDIRVINDDGSSLTSIVPVCEFVDRNANVPSCNVGFDLSGQLTCEGELNCPLVNNQGVVTLTLNGNPLCIDPDTCPFENVNGVVSLDTASKPTPLTIPSDPDGAVKAVMSAGGALASPAFFNKFTTTGTHANYLNSSELKLIAEWLDINGRYYNNPFDTIKQ